MGERTPIASKQATTGAPVRLPAPPRPPAPVRLPEPPPPPALGFTSVEQELDDERLEVQGELPAWLQGTLIRNGPARFEAGERVRHWFDGLAMLHRFSIADGRVSYGNRFLRTKSFRASEEGRIGYREFASDPCRSLFRRVATLFGSNPHVTDNAAVNVVRIADEFVAMAENPMPIVFDPRTLETLGVADAPPGLLPTAHPQVDPASGETVNFAVHLGARSAYRLYVHGPGGTARTICSIPVREPAYLHSFGLTENHAILVLGPLVVNPIELALSPRPFIENYRWEPDRGTEILAIDRRSGRVASRWSADPVFLFHHVNAYEADGEMVVDICGYDDAALIEDLYLDRLAESGDIAEPRPRRYRLPAGGGRADWRPLADVELEMPRIHPRRSSRRHSVVWGTSRHDGRFASALVRLDVDEGVTRRWHEPCCHPGEPVFVPRPGATAEDDGVLLSVVLDAGAGSSFLLVLEAETLEETARAAAPHHIPFGVHGQFFDDLG
ncbi:MAG TPA: carotenoid oxygenase family protein [Thermoleophilaceae bacterium]|jgi:carotenoid cleavage dioxygenase-like enzyme